MALKSSKLKKTLQEKAVENTTVSVGTRSDQTVKKADGYCEQSAKGIYVSELSAVS